MPADSINPGSSTSLEAQAREQRVPLWIVFLLALVVLALANWLARSSFRSPDTVKSHLAALRHLEFKPGGRLNNWPAIARYIQWLLHGRHSAEQVFALREEHERALVRLGYVQQRKFVLEHQMTSGAQAIRDLTAMGQQRIVRPPDHQRLTHIQYSDPWTITITAVTNELLIWTDIIRQFDAAPHP